MLDPLPDAVQTTVTAQPAAPPRLAGRVAALGEVMLASGFPTQLGIGALLFGLGLDMRAPDGRLSMSYVVALWLIDAAVLMGLITALLRSSGERLGELLFGSRSQLREVVLGIVLLPVVFALVVGALMSVRWLWPGLHNVAVNPFEELIRSRADAALMAVVAVLSGGIKEEVQRAFVLRRFDQHLGGARVGLVIFSVAFGAGHFIQGWDVGVATTLLGLFWGVLYLKRGSFTASAVSHSGFNVAQIVQFLAIGS